MLNGSGTLDLNGNSITLTGVPTGAGGVITSSTGSPILTMNNVTATYSAGLSGSLGLTVTGSGTLTLSGVETYTGATIVNSGTLNLAANNNTSGGGTIGTSSQPDHQQWRHRRRDHQ